MRLLSLIIALGYMLLGFFASPSWKQGLGISLLIGGFLLIPLACIWFGDEMGDYIGMLPGPGITKRTPAAFVKVGGWILLLLPLVAGFLMFRK